MGFPPGGRSARVPPDGRIAVNQAPRVYANVFDVPDGVMTVTAAGPAVPAGIRPVICVPVELMTGEAIDTAPNFTDVAPVK